jgi:threonine aldolase
MRLSTAREDIRVSRTNMPKIIDLRSDTVTRPSAGMRAAMAAAEVGDDVYSDDPTVNRLQERFAKLVGKEAALFVTSGTQGNQVCIRAHCVPGDEIICDHDSHIVHYEAGGPAALTGASILPLRGARGIFTAAEVTAAVRPDNVHFTPSKLVVIENTHNRGGGTIWPLRQIAEVTAAAKAAKLKTHLDGARLFNAVAATGIAPAEWASHFDSLTCCFSKGLGAPVGSIVAGTKDFVRSAARWRKMFGGQLRQVGVLAAAAEYALDHHVKRLADDHANAKILIEGLARGAGFSVEPDLPTNMVFWRIGKSAPGASDALVAKCKARGVLFNHAGGGRLRAVTHLDVNADDCRHAAEVIREEAAALE